jgi:hypothetical protein
MQYFGADFALISGGIMEEWGLPVSIYAPLLDTHHLSDTRKPLDERLLAQGQCILWVQQDPLLAEQRCFNASSLCDSTLHYTQIQELYRQAQIDAKKIQQII